MEIKIPSIELISVDKLTVDGKNPNKMTTKQKEALRENFKRYGFIVPLITNKEYLIADGEHRLEIAIEEGMTEVPVIALQVNDVDRRIIRQVLNKLRGTHEFELDIQEYKYITENNALTDLSVLLAESENALKTLVDYKRDMPMFKEKEINFIKTEKKCPKCGYEW